MHPNENRHPQSSKAFLPKSFSFFRRLRHCKTTFTKRRRVYINNFMFVQPHNVELRGYMDSIDEMKSKSPNVNKVPLNEEDQKSWLEFKKLDEGKPVLSMFTEEIANKVKIPIKVDHPFVRVVGDFAIASYNEVYEMHVKKGEYNNLRHHEVIECKYLHLFRDYCFYMTIEAIEEGILGVYQTIVVCDPRDGRRTLIKFFLTFGKPTGKISMMLPHLVCQKSKYRSMKEMKKDLDMKMETTHTFMKGMNNKGKVTAELIRLKEQHKAMKGVCNVLYRNIRLQIPTNWNERSNPDGWCVPNPRASGLKERCNDATCKGYNYKTPGLTHYGMW